MQSYDFAAQPGQPTAAYSAQQLEEACRVVMIQQDGWVEPGGPLVACLTSDGQVVVVPGSPLDDVCAGVGMVWLSPLPPASDSETPATRPTPLAAPNTAAVPFGTWGATCYASTDRAPDGTRRFGYGDYSGTPEVDYPSIENLVDACHQTLVREQWVPEDTTLVACLAADGLVEIYPETEPGDLLCAGLGMPVVR